MTGTGGGAGTGAGAGACAGAGAGAGGGGGIGAGAGAGGGTGAGAGARAGFCLRRANTSAANAAAEATRNILRFCISPLRFPGFKDECAETHQLPLCWYSASALDASGRDQCFNSAGGVSCQRCVSRQATNHKRRVMRDMRDCHGLIVQPADGRHACSNSRSLQNSDEDRGKCWRSVHYAHHANHHAPGSWSGGHQSEIGDTQHRHRQQRGGRVRHRRSRIVQFRWKAGPCRWCYRLTPATMNSGVCARPAWKSLASAIP